MTWTDTDKTCPNCGAVTEKAKGFTKQNLKRLFSWSWSWNDMLILFIIIMVVFMAWSYNNETKVCRTWIKDMFSGSFDNCVATCSYKCSVVAGNILVNYTNEGLETNESIFIP